MELFQFVDLVPRADHSLWTAVFGDDNEKALNGLRDYLGTTAAAPPLLSVEGFWNGRDFYVGTPTGPPPGIDSVSAATGGRWDFVGRARGEPIFHRYDVCVAAPPSTTLALLLQTVLSDLRYDNNGVVNDRLAYGRMSRRSCSSVSLSPAEYEQRNCFLQVGTAGSYLTSSFIPYWG